MGCCASVVKAVPAEGSEYEEQDVYINRSEYDEGSTESCKGQYGEITYSKADSDGVITKESPGFQGVRKKVIVAQAFVVHGINSDPNQYTADALKESPKLTRKETTRVLQWVDDTIQCALYQYIANNPKKSHVTLRGIASSAKFKNRTHIYSDTYESCGITDSSQASAPDIALNVGSMPSAPRPVHLSIPTVDETKSASSNASKVRSKAQRRGSASSDSNFSTRTGKSAVYIDSPVLSPDERTWLRAFDVRLAFSPSLSKIINMDGALLVLNQHCQAVQLARESGSQTFGSTVGSTSANKVDEAAAKVGLPSFRSVSDFSVTKLADVRELCMKFSLEEPGVGRGNLNVDSGISQFQLKDYSDDVSKQLHLLADRSDSVATPSASDQRADSLRTNDHGEPGSFVFPAIDRVNRTATASHAFEVSGQQSQNRSDFMPLGRSGSPMESTLTWKERTLTFDALKTFTKYQAFLLKQKKAEEHEFDRQIHTRPPSLRVLVFGPYPYASHFVRPGLIPLTGPLTGASRAALQRNMLPARRVQSQPQSGSDSD